MTKDWDSVRAEIKELSFNQKKCLEEVKELMEKKYKFRASTRAYRMKLKEWGYMRHRARKTTKTQNQRREQEQSEEMETDGDNESERSNTVEPNAAGTPDTAAAPALNLLEEAQDLLPRMDPWAQGRSMTTDIVMEMLGAVLDADSEKLEKLITKNPNHINLPVGLPFQAHGGRYFNHLASNQMVILQHQDQTLLDIACGMPSGPVVWVLVAHGAHGSRHPLGSDLALHNAIKNGRIYTVQSLINSGKSSVHGPPGTSWSPMLQATFWNVPEIARILIDKGANVNDYGCSMDGSQSALQFCLDRRMNENANRSVKERCNTILKMLLDAGADIHIPPAAGMTLTPFETFIQPWQSDSHWIAKLTSREFECLESFVKNGANLQVRFTGFPCGSPTSITFEHQVLWHSTPTTARLLIDTALPTTQGNGSNLLHEILGCCEDARRHPADTLRDIEVLLKRGADPNFADSSGIVPLRKCIERCPAVDVIARLQVLLDGGADPELQDQNGVQPFVLAARAFEEPLLSQVMHLLVSKMHGRHTRILQQEPYIWAAGYFPIPNDPTFEQLSAYSEQNGDFMSNLGDMVPHDVHGSFRRACLSVSSKNFLNAIMNRAKMIAPLQLTANEKDQLYQALSMRSQAGLPEYKFDQEFVMSLLKPHLAPIRTGTLPDLTSNIALYDMDIMLPHQTPISSSAPPTSNILSTTSMSTNLAPLPDSSSRRSSTSSNSSTSFFIPTTTHIRWSSEALARATEHGDIKKAKELVLKYKCKTCNNGNLLTKAELESHDKEHAHTVGCFDEVCARRFCAIRKKGGG